MPGRSTLGMVIRRRRLQLGWTQEELAERICGDGEDVRQSEISRIETGKITLPCRERLERLAAALDLPLGELLARSGWAGADDFFNQPPSGLTEMPLAHVGGLADTPAASFTEEIISDDSLRGSNQAGRAPYRRAFQNAVRLMHEESSRLARNCQTTEEIVRGFARRYERDIRIHWADDQPDLAGT